MRSVIVSVGVTGHCLVDNAPGPARGSRLYALTKSTKAALNYLFTILKRNECPKLNVSICGCEFVALLDLGASRVFVGLAG
jgi:hypothetical protein